MIIIIWENNIVIVINIYIEIIKYYFYNSLSMELFNNIHMRLDIFCKRHIIEINQQSSHQHTTLPIY